MQPPAQDREAAPDAPALRGLPDVLGPGLSVLFCSLTAGSCAVERGHHYSSRGDAFWSLVHEAGLTPRRLTAQDSALLPSFGLGLTGLVRAASLDASSPWGVAALAAKVQSHRPRWVAFTGKGTAAVAATAWGHRSPALGPQPWTLGPAAVFVLPSSSSANQRNDYDGRARRSDWWGELGQLVRAEG